MKKTILIVDDFENSLFVTGVTIQSKGYNVLKASSGAQAMELLNGQPVHLIITDYNMPQMSGLQLVERIKALDKYSGVPIFVLSTEIKPEVKERAMKLGVTVWIQKPFKIENLIKYITRAIE